MVSSSRTSRSRVGPTTTTSSSTSSNMDMDTIKTIDPNDPLTTLPFSCSLNQLHDDDDADNNTDDDDDDEGSSSTANNSSCARSASGHHHHQQQQQQLKSTTQIDEMIEDDEDSQSEEGGSETHPSTDSTVGRGRSNSYSSSDSRIGGDDANYDLNQNQNTSLITGGSDDKSDTADGESLDNSMSLTDLNSSNKETTNHHRNNKNKKNDKNGSAKKAHRAFTPRSPHHDHTNNSSTEGSDGNVSEEVDGNNADDETEQHQNNNFLPTPPGHFTCPIQNTLFVDPVIDREGNTYERSAILRWLVLSGGECTKSPITGNSMSVEELVEDTVVKDAIERWRKECWVRFLLGNKVEVAGGEVIDDEEHEDERGEAASRGDMELEGGIAMEDNRKDTKKSSSKKKGSGGGMMMDVSERSGKSERSSKAKKKKSKSFTEGGLASSDADKLNRKKLASSTIVHGSHTSKSSSKSRSSQKKKFKEDNASGNNADGPRIISPSPSLSPSSPTDAHHANKKIGSNSGIKNQTQPPLLRPPTPKKEKLSTSLPPPSSIKRNKEKNGALLSSSHSSRKSKSSSQGRTSKSNKGSSGVRISKTKKGVMLSSSQRTTVTSNTAPTTTGGGGVVMMKASATSKKSTGYSSSSPPPPINAAIIPHNNISSASSFCSNLSTPYDLFSLPPASTNVQPRQQYNGWSVPLGVHKVICAAPGLRVTNAVHRRSPPVKVPNGAVDINGKRIDRELVIPPGCYVEILETQVHGDRVRGRICWEEEEVKDEHSGKDDKSESKKSKKKTLKKRTSRLLKRTSRKDKKKDKRGRGKSTESNKRQQLVRYEGWISVQWAKGDDEIKDDITSSNGGGGATEGSDQKNKMDSMVTDEDAGPWTEPVPLGVYRINFSGGLPLRETPERDSTVLGKLDRGRCVEVVQTQVKGDRVRARVIVPQTQEDINNNNDAATESTSGGSSNNNNNKGVGVIKYTSGWISLLNALTGSSGASPVPLGAYVVVAEPGCVITEGGRLDSKTKGNLAPGSCMEVVATRMEEGVVRGLIDGGGHVTLFMPPPGSSGRVGGGGTNNKSTATSRNNGRQNADGGRMFAMPVPLGTYQIIQNGLSVTAGISSTSSILMKLQVNVTAEIVETRVENGRVRGRICAVINEDGTRVVGYERSGSVSGSASEACGWINLFEPNMRWAKIVCFKGGRPVNGGSSSGSTANNNGNGNNNGTQQQQQQQQLSSSQKEKKLKGSIRKAAC